METQGLKPQTPHHWDLSPVACGGLKPLRVNCLKLQKRLMFGRANFDLLRLRVLRRA